MKLTKLSLPFVSVLLLGSLQLSTAWAGGAAGGATGAAGVGAGAGGNTGAAGVGAGAGGNAGANGVGVGAGGNAGAAGVGVDVNGNAGANGSVVPNGSTTNRTGVNPNQPAAPAGQTQNNPAPVRKDINRVDPANRDTRARSNTSTVPPATNNTCTTIDGQMASGSQCTATGATPNTR
ncbi:hypothetical protein [Methylophilus luteus]|uniref:PE-PGRS family protein n=1 Tax=Methylophilus luteus TaxID=640108 RepID=A0ABW3F2X5_9PROT